MLFIFLKVVYCKIILNERILDELVLQNNLSISIHSFPTINKTLVYLGA